MDTEQRRDAMDERGRKIIRVIDPFSFCTSCGSNENVEVTPAELGVSWSDCGCKSRVRVCFTCQLFASEACPHGQEIRGEKARRGGSISLPGRPTRQLVRELAPLPREISRFQGKPIQRPSRPH